jgi:AraC family transcriptional regulator
MQIAAHLLQHSGNPIAAIAYEVGYETPSSLSKAFKNHFGVSPSEYREKRMALKRNARNLLFNLKETDMNLKPEIRQMEEMKVIYIQAIGDYNNVGPAWERLCSFAGRKGLLGPDTQMFGLSHDDPDVTETSKLRYDACIVAESAVEPEGEVGIKTVEGGEYAVFLHKGPYAELKQSYNDIFRNWLPQNNRELGDAAPIEIYLNDPEKTKPEDLLTEICIPLK